MTDPEKRPCSGCGKTILPGDSNWCPSDCSCLGARWCTVCVNRHLDARQALFLNLSPNDPRPDFKGFAAALRDEASWSAALHRHDTTGQAATDQEALSALADRVLKTGARLGYSADPIEDRDEDVPEDMREALGPPGAADAAESDRYQIARRTLEASELPNFLQWLCSPRAIPSEGRRVKQHQIQLAVRWGHDDTWVPIGEHDLDFLGERIFAAFFNIDLDAVERHRQRLLAQIQESPPHA